MNLLKMKQIRGTDNLATPKEAVDVILPFLPKKIWECATGEGKLATILENNGKEVFRGYDFLTDDFSEADAIVTNPPFSLKTRFLERAYELGKPFAFLLPITSLEGKKRQFLYDKNGLEIVFLDKRVDFTGKGAPWFAVAWFTNGLKIGKQLTFLTSPHKRD